MADDMDSANRGTLIAQGLDHLNEGFGIFDESLKLVSCNRPFQTLRNYPAELCVPGTSLEAMIRFSAERGDFGPRPVDEEVAERMAEIAEASHREIEREMAGGQILKIRYQSLKGGGLTVTFEDKTAERRAQAALEISEERYALVSEAAEEAVYEWNIETGQFFASPRLKAFLGMEDAGTVFRDWRWGEKVHPDDLELYETTLATHLDGTQERWDCEYRLLHQSGSYRWVSDHGTSVRDDGGNAIRMIAAIRDITDRIEQEAALAASEERHNLVTQATSDGIYDWDIREDVLFVSDRLNQIFAFDKGQLSSREWAARVHEDDMQGYMAAIRKHFKGQVDHMECEYRIRNKSGDYRWVRDHAIGVRGDDGKVKRLVGAVRDVTDVKAAHEALAEARDRFQDAIEALSSGFVLFDADDRIVVCNSKYREYFPKLADMVAPGTPFADIIQTAMDRGLFPESGDNPDEWLAALLKRRAAASGVREQHLDGGLWLQISDHRTKDGGIVSIYTDVTELKNREEELRTQSAILEATLENMEQGISMVDPDLNVVMFNKKFLEFFQFPEDQFKRGFPMEQAFRLNAERGEYGVGDIEQQIQERLELSQKFLPHRFERTTANDTAMEIVGNPVEGGGFVTTYSDITERKQREADLTAAKEAAERALQDLQKAQDRLVQAEKMASLGQLTAGIAHEIKNPLNFVNNFAKLSGELLVELAEILKDPMDALEGDDRDDAEDLFETVKQNLSKINEHGRRADSIVKNMLLHSREGPSERQRADLNALAEEALNLAYHGARAENPNFNIEMVKALAPEVGDIECYSQDLMRVFLNLITNGIYAANKRKASEKEIDPTISLTTQDLGDKVSVEIRDNGSGIPTNVQEKIFTPFFTTKPAGEGTGLGLSLSYDIVVKQHGGTLSVDSEPGVFTSFVVTVPRSLPEMPAEGDAKR